MAKKREPESNPPEDVLYYTEGRLSGREVKAQKRLEELTAKYQASGLSEVDAREQARKEMRDNARGDWRA